MTTLVTLAPGLPGLSVGGRPAGPRPRTLLGPGPLLLTGVDPGRLMPLSRHRRLWGSQPDLQIDELIDWVERAEVVGAGGAAFPTARKLASLAGHRVGMVVVNGSEGESASGKDGVLLQHVPHLVLDGAVAVAGALGARRVVVRISQDRPDLLQPLQAAIRERSDRLPMELSVGPASFASGEATAVIRALTGGPALPADLGRPPVAPGRTPRSRAHVMLSNVETFARVAVACRGILATSALVSASGAVRGPGVAELPVEWTLADVAGTCGGLVGDPWVLITGGWHGRWSIWESSLASAPLTRAGLAESGGRWGAGAFVWIPEDVRPMDALIAVAHELAAGTAEQCGPCWRGLPELAHQIERAASGVVGRGELESLMSLVDGRGLCAHPSAAVAALRSALDLIGVPT
jgi:NADH:ubiquinone oxidoreductase subunit F (NADH-binding)